MNKPTKSDLRQRDKGVAHTFDRNGALVVNTRSLMANGSFKRQIQAAAQLARLTDKYKKL